MKKEETVLIKRISRFTDRFDVLRIDGSHSKPHRSSERSCGLSVGGRSEKCCEQLSARMDHLVVDVRRIVVRGRSSRFAVSRPAAECAELVVRLVR